MADQNKIDMNELRDLIEWLNISSDIKAFSLKYGDLEIKLSRREHDDDASAPTAEPAPPVAAPAPAPVAKSPAPGPAAAPGGAAPREAGEGEVLIKAPMVGTFYTSSKPGAPAFVEVGQSVKANTVLCIIEVMKLMNSLEAKVEGVIKEIYVSDNEPVEYGQPLMLIEAR